MILLIKVTLVLACVVLVINGVHVALSTFARVKEMRSYIKMKARFAKRKEETVVKGNPSNEEAKELARKRFEKQEEEEVKPTKSALSTIGFHLVMFGCIISVVSAIAVVVTLL